MRLLFVADFHYALKQFDWLVENAGKYEAVIIGGDLLDLSSALDLDVQIVVVEQYLNRLCDRTRVLVCSGNHDLDARDANDERAATWLAPIRRDRLHVDGDCVHLGACTITICPWWDGPLAQQAVVALLERDAAQVQGPWIWVHHAPPQDSPVSWNGRKHVGDPFLIEMIERFKPRLVLSGHVHNAPFYPDGSWIDQLGETWVFNPGRQLGPLPAFLELDAETMEIEWVSLDGQDQRALGAV